MKKKQRNFLRAIYLILLLLTVASMSVSAHRIYLDVVQQTITVEAYYGDGKAAKNADITVYKADGEIYLNGTTDEDGLFSFKIVEGVDSKNLTIEVEHVGHKDSITIGVSSVATEGDEPFLPFQAIAGFGYILGITGIVTFYGSWKMKSTGKK